MIVSDGDDTQVLGLGARTRRPNAWPATEALQRGYMIDFDIDSGGLLRSLPTQHEPSTLAERAHAPRGHTFIPTTRQSWSSWWHRTPTSSTTLHTTFAAARPRIRTIDVHGRLTDLISAHDPCYLPTVQWLKKSNH